MCLAQGHKAAMRVRLKPVTPQSGDKHSTTEPLRSPPSLLKLSVSNIWHHIWYSGGV